MKKSFLLVLVLGAWTSVAQADYAVKRVSDGNFSFDISGIKFNEESTLKRETILLNTPGSTVEILSSKLSFDYEEHGFRYLADYAIPQVHPHTLVFIGKGKLEISVKFTGSQLFGLDKVKSFDSDFVNTDIHKEQKKKIVVTVLLEMFSGQSTIDAGAVFEKFSEFHRKTCSSYELYVADFSFEKIKGEVVKEKVDSIIKVNKIFSDIQNQLLAVPIAILLAGGQLDQTGKDPIKNVLIWLGILVFSVFMSFLIRNQRNSLASVNAEVLQHREQLRSKYQAIASKFSEDFKDVSKRISHQVNLLRVVDLVVASIFIGITVLTLSFNGWLDEFLHNLLLIVDKTTYLILLGIAAIAVWIKGFVS